jgi:hypothetical protein
LIFTSFFPAYFKKNKKKNEGRIGEWNEKEKERKRETSK